MIYVECRSNSPEWYQTRSGKITASRFTDAVDVLARKSGDKNAGDPSEKSDLYCAEVAMEIINGGPIGKNVTSWAMDRGHEMEDYAIMAYEERFGVMVQKAGICVTEDGKFSYSSDGLVNADGLVEVKSPVNAMKIIDMWRSDDNSDYIHQELGGLWISGRKWIDLIMYAPQLANCGAELYVQRLYRNEEQIDDMVWKLYAFDKRVQATVAYLRTLKDRPSPIILNAA